MPSGVNNENSAQITGRWLVLARVGWVAVTLLILGLNAAMIPRYYTALQALCRPGAACVGLQATAYDRQLLHRLGLSLGFVAAYRVVLDAGSVALYCAVGALIFWRKSADRMALYCAFMLVLFGGAGFPTIIQDTLAPVSRAGFALAGALEVLGQSSFPIFFLLFPSGRFVPRWTRGVALFAILNWTYQVFFTNSMTQVSGSGLSSAVLFLLLLFVLGAQVYRYRRVSAPREREQTKWVVYGFAIGVGGFVLYIGLGYALLPAAVLTSNAAGTLLAGTGVYGFLSLIPISIAVAILRSRLWDIDIIIRRTLIYGTLTATLAAVYFAVVVIAQIVGDRLTDQKSPPAWLIVVTTLLIAALFTPLRRAIQRIIDRRFYRSKYNAARTLEAFAAALRTETDLAELSERLVAVVEETMRPAHVSLWLPAPTATRRVFTHGAPGSSMLEEAQG